MYENEIFHHLNEILIKCQTLNDQCRKKNVN